MVRDDILRGLEAALLRGSSLRDAMMSFFNAGYKKEDIEEAAKYIVQLQQKALQQKDFSQGKPAVQQTTQTTKTVFTQKTVSPTTAPPAMPTKTAVPSPPQQKPQSQAQTQQTSQILQQLKNIPSLSQMKSLQQPQSSSQMQVPTFSIPTATATKTEQKVSSYGETEKTEKKGVGKGVIILLSLILAILIGALIATVVFKQQVTDFLVNLFGLTP